jgi:molecular chaperone DnaK
MAIIGIDLGTSNSAAAVLRGGRPVMIPSAEGVTLGGKAFPSYVAMTADGQVLVGEPARCQATINPEGTATAFKRRMGRRELIRLRDRELSPEQLSAFLLQKIKRDAEAYLGEPIDRAVVTIPAGTQPGTVLRLQGRGLPVSGGRRKGDLYLAIKVHVPERLTTEERQLYERLRALGGSGSVPKNRRAPNGKARQRGE